MNRLEEKIQSEINEFFGSPKGVEELGSKTFRNALIDIQKDVAVKFAEWRYTLTYEEYPQLYTHYVGLNEFILKGTSMLFDYFITNVYGK